MASANLMISGAHIFRGKGGKPPHALWSCLPLRHCLFASAGWKGDLQPCPRGLLFSLHGEKGDSVILVQVCLLWGRRGTARPCAWCNALQRCGMVPAACLAPLHVLLPNTRLSFSKWSSWVRGVWFTVFNLSRSVKKKRHFAVGLILSHSCPHF